MPSMWCCVPHCSNSGGHKFPKNPALRKKWIHAVKRANWKPTSSSLVCKNHFTPDQYKEINIFENIPAKRQLKADAVPNVFLWSKKEAPSVVSRRARRENRERKVQDNHHACYIMDTGTLEIGGEVIIDEEEEKATCLIENNVASTMVCVTTQTHTFEVPMSVERFEFDNNAIHYYTGLENYNSFNFVLQSLGPAAYSLKYYKFQVVTLAVPNQLFLTLIKLRLNTANFELSRMFSVSEETVRNVFITWINFMYLQWQELDIWSERSLVDTYMPRDFKMKFPNTRVIIDSLECKISKPKNPVAQQATWSSYKNDNTLKAVVGCTPGGLVSFVSEAYGGSASDRQIAERSSLCKITEAKDCVMADRGFNIQDLLITKDVVVNTPTFMRGKAQLSSSLLSRDRKISSKRIHIERIIGMARTYKILRQHMHPTVTKLGSEIIFICFMLCNFRPCLVGRDA
ncbi:uncharacterized protein [Centruroides vittatus]|uniref:uncharacterized protein n=1 Tax=Centruroides vittatus TaxID=120091 RepID=UPI00350F0926